MGPQASRAPVVRPGVIHRLCTGKTPECCGTRNFWAAGPALEEGFRQVELATGLWLNSSKCRLLPLWRTWAASSVRALFAEAVPRRKDCALVVIVSYLLFVVRRRNSKVRRMGLGIHFAPPPYRICAVSFLGSVIQLRPVPDGWGRLRAGAFWHLAQRPGGWLPVTQSVDLEVLHIAVQRRAASAVPEAAQLAIHLAAREAGLQDAPLAHPWRLWRGRRSCPTSSIGLEASLEDAPLAHPWWLWGAQVSPHVLKRVCGKGEDDGYTPGT